MSKETIIELDKIPYIVFDRKDILQIGKIANDLINKDAFTMVFTIHLGDETIEVDWVKKGCDDNCETDCFNCLEWDTAKEVMNE